VEAGRVDPHFAARAAAVRAIGVLGGDRAVGALKDLWLKADGRLRDAIVDGFRAPATFEAGGREQLVRIAESGQDGNISAALSLAHLSIDEGPEKHAKAIAIGVLVRAIKLGTREDRTAAMLGAPIDDDVLKALREAKDDSDAGIALVALGRLAQEEKKDKDRKAAKDKLLTIAKGKDPEAHRAMGELARMGDRRVVALLDKQLASKNAAARGYAARSLVLLREFTRAAPALADSDSYVRASTACAILKR
jgi:HEAT repeat protein